MPIAIVVPIYRPVNHEDDDVQSTDFFSKRYSDLEDIKYQDATPKGLHDAWRLTPSLMDSNSFAFWVFANQPSGFYTSTPAGINTLYHGAAKDLHNPGMGTKLSDQGNGTAIEHCRRRELQSTAVEAFRGSGKPKSSAVGKAPRNCSNKSGAIISPGLIHKSKAIQQQGSIKVPTKAAPSNPAEHLQSVEAVVHAHTILPKSACRIQAAVCLYVRVGEDSSGYHRAIYLKDRTMTALIRGVQEKFCPEIGSTIRLKVIDWKGSKILVNEEVLQHLVDGQDLIVYCTPNTIEQVRDAIPPFDCTALSTLSPEHRSSEILSDSINFDGFIDDAMYLKQEVEG